MKDRMPETMTDLFEQLGKLMDGETDLCRSFLSVLQNEKRALIDSDLDGLNASGKEKENLLLKIQILEEERQRVCAAIGRAAGIAGSGVRLGAILEKVGPPQREALETRRSNLRSLVQGIQEINQGNRTLVRHSMDLVRSSLNLLDGLTASHSVYHRSGRMEGARSRGRMLSSQV